MSVKSESFSLDAKYTQEQGRIYLSGIQALVRLLFDQRRADRRRGLKTATFVSGYRGSPLGGLDQTLERHGTLLREHDVVFSSGLNEDLAATAVFGSQMAGLFPNPKYDGVLGMWYGKAPGVDRSGDAFKHANYAGVGKNGGVLALVGDDPISKSSTLPSHSEVALWDALMPTIYPGNVQEILDLGLHGFMMSRVSGLWVGMKIVTNVADEAATADVHPERVNPVIPTVELDGKPFQHQINVNLIPPYGLDMERTLHGARLELARRYAYENKLNRIVVPTPEAWLGILTTGKTYYDVRQALAELGLDEAALNRYGIRILKMGMLFPMEPRIVREFARGLQEVLVVEEKRGFLELFARDILYGWPDRPQMVGKFDEEERPLIPIIGELDTDVIARAIAKRLARKVRIESVEARIERLEEFRLRPRPLTLARTAFFCSGCPHNRSTVVPEGSVAAAGIGCHGMAMGMDRGIIGITHMGGEGAQWIGVAPFTGTPHLFQNIGDGTLFHSGSLAINYAVASGVNITYKILYNSAVAMTGGQDAAGAIPIPALTRRLEAEGVKKIIITTDDPARYKGVTIAANADVWHRDRLLEAQSLLAGTSGVTALIHDQQCAAEKRRLRKRGKQPDPNTRVFINERVCEGCGDCGVKSNCMSVEPVATEFGRKTRIHQSSCNKDYSCVKGFCPSFLTITPNPEPTAADAPKKKKKGRIPALERALPDPVNKVDASFGFGIHVMGIGGTGSVTVVATLANAARLEGKHVIGLDQTGLAQKGGAVISDIKITNAPFDGSNKISDGRTDLYLGFDILNATDPKNLDKCHPSRTIAVVSTTQTPTGQMVSDRHVLFPATQALTAGIDRVTRKAENVFLDGQALAEGLFGDAMATNNFMVGVAYQAGTIPLKAESIETAIKQSGVAVEMSLAAFRWGRMAVVDRAFVEAEIAKSRPKVAELPQMSSSARAIVDSVGAQGETKRLLEVRVPDLIDYQDEAYARRYADVVKRVVDAEQKAVPGQSGLAEAAARYLYKLMAYKDEFEVARLHTDPAFLAKLDAQFKHGYTVKYNLAPPTISKRDPITGELQKRQFGPWMLSAFRMLAKFKGLRGGALDIFGNTEERRHERQLIDDYIKLLDEIASKLNAANHATAVQLATVPDEIRGYGHVKERSIKVAKAAEASLLQQFRSPQPKPVRQVA